MEEDKKVVLDRAHELGYCGHFGDRETLGEAGNFALELLKNCAVDPGDNIALTTGMAVLLNTGCLIQARLELEIERLKKEIANEQS